MQQMDIFNSPLSKWEGLLTRKDGMLITQNTVMITCVWNYGIRNSQIYLLAVRQTSSTHLPCVEEKTQFSRFPPFGWA